MVDRLLRDERTRDAELLIAEALARYEHCYAEAARAWEKSWKPVKKYAKKQYIAADGSRQTRTVRVTEGGLPDAKYLDAMLKSLAGVRELLGLDVPRRADAPGAGDEERRARVSAPLDEFAPFRQGPAPGPAAAELPRADPGPPAPSGEAAAGGLENDAHTATRNGHPALADAELHEW